MDHARAERRSVLYHREIANRIERDESIVARALDRVETWLKDGSVARYYAQAWREVLLRPTLELRAFLVDTSDHAQALRQVSPFAGVLSPRERWTLWASEGEADDATAA